MKIAHIVCVYPPYRSGIGNSVKSIADALAGLGHEITVFTPDYKLPDEGDEKENIIVKRLKPIFTIGNGAVVPQLYSLLDGYDIVHLHYPFYGAVETVLLKKIFSGNKIQLILHYHMDAKARGAKRLIFYLYKKLLLPALARQAKIITCASLDYIKHSDLKKYYRLRPDKFRQISFGVNPNKFSVTESAGRSNGGQSILFVGGLDKAHYFKGLENLIKALAEIRKTPEFSSAILNIVGRGDLMAYYKNCAEKAGIAKAVVFNDRVNNDNLVDFYNRGDCLVLPSINQAEAFGLVVLEAMACAKPVIASNLPGVRSSFKNGKQGLLVKPGDVKDLAKKLQMILGNKKQAELMGRAGRELILKKYTWDKVAKKLNVIYHYVKYAQL
ncbi:MAG: glycosyltransferase family 4 protein [Patescibacteria group bacterium]|nr:glycosyltransferase family 4 protein [Patescibacteria group bacterium]